MELLTAAGAGRTTTDASLLMLRKAMNADKSQAQSLLQSVLPPPPSLGPGKGLRVDVYA